MKKEHTVIITIGSNELLELVNREARKTGLQDGYYIVDRMSLHGGAPWLSQERFVSKEEEK